MSLDADEIHTKNIGLVIKRINVYISVTVFHWV